MSEIDDLIERMMTSDEQTVWKMLSAEKRGAARPYLMRRLYGRAAVLRKAREQTEMAQALIDRSKV